MAIAASAVLQPLWSYVGKPLVIGQLKKTVDEFFDPATAKVLKKMMGEGADLTGTLEDITASLEQVKALMKENTWVTAWANTHTQLSALGTLLLQHADKRDTFLEAQAKVKERQTRTTEAAFATAAASYYTSCIKCLGENGVGQKSRDLVSQLLTPFPHMKSKTLLDFSAELLNREYVEVFTFADAMDNILEQPFKYLVNSIAVYEQARQFQQAAQGYKYEGRPELVLDDSFSFDSREGKKLLKKYKDLTGEAHTMKWRLEQLAKTKEAVGIRSLRWPLSEKTEYDCYLTACADGTPHSGSKAVEEKKTAGGNGALITSYEIGIKENRLRHGLPQVFPFRLANGAKIEITETNDTYQMYGGAVGKAMNQAINFGYNKVGQVFSRTDVSYEQEDADNRVRLAGKHVPKFNWLDLYPGSLVTGGGVFRTERKFVFEHDRESQSWRVETESESGKTYVLLRHVKSGLLLGAMRLDRVYLTRDKIQSRWELVLTDRGQTLEGGNEADKLGFILRSAHESRHALSCDFSSVNAESEIKGGSKAQHLQFYTWK